MNKCKMIIFSKTKFYGVVCIMLMVIFIFGMEYYYALKAQSGSQATPAPAPVGEVRLVVNLVDCTLSIYDDGQLYKRYPVAVGKKTTPTPQGMWTINYKEHSNRPIFGTRWMRLDIPWGSYGIHGTNMPWSIGSLASSGCIRMRNKDAEELYPWVDVGTPVEIIGSAAPIQRELAMYMMGQDVMLLQMKLKQIGYLETKPTGIFGSETQEAVKRYQHDHALAVTGRTSQAMLHLLGL